MKHIIGNWKMNLGVRESAALARGVLRGMRGKDITPHVVLCPAFTALSEVHKVVARSRVDLGAQNIGTERQGAFTGEVSPVMLEDVHASFVIIGHSERRQIFGESDELVHDRLMAALQSKLTPILCVGETDHVRKAGDQESFVTGQLQSALAGLTIGQHQTVMIAYEPIWAIGTGHPATVDDAIAMHKHIRTVAEGLLPGTDIVILYGGSVTADNAYELLREPEIDGVLVGGASIRLQEFGEIIDAGVDVVTAQEA